MRRSQAHRVFVPIVLVASIAIIGGADILARMSYEKVGLGIAIKSVWEHPVADLFGMFMLTWPLIAAELLAVECARITDIRRGMGILFLNLLFMIMIYYAGFSSYQDLLHRERWTDASLSLMFTVLQSFVVLAVSLFAIVLLSRKRPRTPTPR